MARSVFIIWSRAAPAMAVVWPSGATAPLSLKSGSLSLGVGTESDPLGSRCPQCTCFEVEGRGRQMGKFSGDEVGDGDQMPDGGVAARLGLGGLDERVGGFDATIGEFRVEGGCRPSGSWGS